MKRYDVYALGNALVDLEYEVDDRFLQIMGLQKGLMSLMEGVEQQRLLQALHQDYSCIKRAGGGSAANTVYAVAGLGGAAFYSCRVADDESGNYYLKDLIQANIGFSSSQPQPAGQTGTCVVLITPDAERTMQTHLGVSAQVSADDVDPDSLIHAQWLYLEGYLAPSASARAAVQQARSLARLQRIPVALSCSDPSMVQYFRDGVLELLESGVDILFCNEEEGRLLSGCADTVSALDVLSRWAPEVVMTCGSEGARINRQGHFEHVPAFVVQPINTNGAGDAFAGAYLYGRTHGMSTYAAGMLACRVSSEVVTQFGARLPFGRYLEILHEHQFKGVGAS